MPRQTRLSVCQHRAHIVATVFCLWLFASTSGLAAGNTKETQDTLTKRRESIAKLNDSQRQDLVRKYDAYRQLTDSERNQLRKLHTDIEADPALQQTLRQYCEWLKNLDVTQREQLRQAKTAEQKRDLVVRIQAEQRRQKDDVWRDNGAPAGDRRPFSPLSSEDLKAVMATLEAELIKADKVLSKERLAEIEKLQGTQRYKMLMRSIGEYRHPIEGSARAWEIPEAVVTTLVDKIDNADLKKKLPMALKNADNFPFLKRMVFMGLLDSTQLEARREFSGPEANALKESLFQSLPQDWKDKYSQTPPWQQDLILMGIHKEELFRYFIMAGDMGNGPQGGRSGQPFPFPRGRTKEGERPREGGPQGGYRPPRSPDTIFDDRPANRRPQPERPREGAEKRDGADKR